MHNQCMSIQCPILVMHELMYSRFSGVWGSDWVFIIKDKSTEEFLLSHGWQLDAYINECRQYMTNPTNPLDVRYMCFQFIKHA